MNSLTIATDVVLAAGGGLGGAGTSGIALTNGIVLLAGLRGSKRVKLNRDKAGGLGIGLGVLSATAGAALSQLSSAAAEIPKSLIAGGTFGNMSLGGTALALTAVIFLFEWKKLWIPAALGIGAGVIYANAGGIWGIVYNGILMAANAVGAL
ncbi:hypothetical protein OS965_34595 [Streptomyces sp. H27-G5]|uniref:hypothetical protein n=1 Tax=Streptomyces sp. H27-G5 TaxID=2996698 RepID=UPI00226EA06E|nr:hypothetical protein [Streptomyces sp. H27-G5]MCY0923209.1 hypothetical protein [Streptomyces sp. H27-G5]